MKKPITLPASIQAHGFDSLQRQAKNSRVKIRLLAMSHLKRGTPYKEVANMVRVHEKTVLSGLRRFKEEGLAGLKEHEGRGAKPRLKPESLYED